MNEHKHAMKCHSGQYCNFYCKINAFEGLQNLPVEGMQESMRNKTLIVKRHITFSSNRILINIRGQNEYKISQKHSKYFYIFQRLSTTCQITRTNIIISAYNIQNWFHKYILNYDEQYFAVLQNTHTMGFIGFYKI